jgi:fructokinase
VIVVCGETMTDLLPVDGPGSPGGTYAAVTGGGPANTAVALARLGTPVHLLGRLSGDGFGRAARQRLEVAGVGLSLVREAPEPAPLAVASLDPDGSAAYVFYTAGTADFGWRADELPALPAGAAVLHAGSLALMTPPGAGALLELVRREAGRRLVSIDPNVRPQAASPQAYRARWAEWLPLAALVRVSTDDLGYVHPGDDPVEVARGWVEAADGPSLVVVTAGAGGATAVGGFGVVHVAAAPTRVVDTVGAGDAFQAGLLDALWRAGVGDPERLAALNGAEIDAALRFAAAVAAVTCARRGADPPYRSEVEIACNGGDKDR